MRCLACDKDLKPHEDARKYEKSGERVQLCDGDFESIKGDVDVIDNRPFRRPTEWPSDQTKPVSMDSDGRIVDAEYWYELEENEYWDDE